MHMASSGLAGSRTRLGQDQELHNSLKPKRPDVNKSKHSNGSSEPILIYPSMVEYSMMDCVFSRYIYPANGS